MIEAGSADIVHDVDHPEDVERSPITVPPLENLAIRSRNIKARLLGVGEVDPPGGWGVVANFQRGLGEKTGPTDLARAGIILESDVASERFAHNDCVTGHRFAKC